jgi:hypothetical protein
MFLAEVIRNARVQILELAACFRAVRLPPVVGELRERDGIERARGKMHAHRDFGFSLRKDVFSDLSRSLLRALAHVDAALILESDVRNAVAEVHTLGSGFAAHRARTVR